MQSPVRVFSRLVLCELKFIFFFTTIIGHAVVHLTRTHTHQLAELNGVTPLSLSNSRALLIHLGLDSPLTDRGKSFCSYDQMLNYDLVGNHCYRQQCSCRFAQLRLKLLLHCFSFKSIHTWDGERGQHPQCKKEEMHVLCCCKMNQSTRLEVGVGDAITASLIIWFNAW